MTDFSKLQTIEEVEHQIDRMQRRASIQQEQLDGYVKTVIGIAQTVKTVAETIYKPFGNAVSKHSQTIKTVWNIASGLIKRIYNK
jgi:hypothetical protein